ncbi:glycosyl hydrolase [Bifidobacterium sp. ESL0732]|uniref:GH39 family glycosyl hydrolase n=1 Tax=Bifidobacterium sp. ESL0732 TaxID=2983222 RepID=UPI0023F6265A|nr:glycosyl hydrolase [Bifidobacterium sp. ESL0732]WEV63614.1 glycosyl hydrolase [Bifidobacterium sp. ESL0732]
MVDFKVSRDSKTSDFPHYWETCVGSCHAYTALREDYRQQLRKAHDELGFRYVRFHGLFDDDMSICIENFGFDGKSQGIQYNFVNLDNIVDFLLSIGMKPFFELGFMPTCLASGKETFGAYHGNITMPKDDNLWTGLIRRFVEHLLDRYGKEEVESWFFEVWNEPNLSAFFTGTQDDYFHLYEMTVRTLKAADPKVRVGGPATSFNSWIPDLINFCKKNEVPLDFISTHQYPTDDPLWKSGKNVDEFFKENKGQEINYRRGILKEMVVEAKQQAGDLPLYYTEWNSSARSDDFIHDEPYTATFVAKTLADNDGIVEGYSFWTFTDIFEEQSQRPGVFHGGFGLQTTQGIEKPSYRIYQIYHQLGEQRLPVESSDPDSTAELLAVRKGDDLQLLAYNVNVPMGTISEQDIDIDLGASAGDMQCALQRIDDDHANPKKQWQIMGSPEYPTAAQIEELRAASSLRTEQLTAHDGHISLTLPTQASAFITVPKYFRV